MVFVSRKFAFLLLLTLAFGAVGCNSNAKKIVGKWKITGFGNEAKSKGDDKIVLFMEFKNDGTGNFGIDVTDPELKKMFGEKDQSVTFKYKVSGDTIELFDVPKDGKKDEGPFGKKDRMKAKLVFEGDDAVTLTPEDDKDKDKPAKLVRMK